MSDDKLNEVGNDNLDKDTKLITDSPSESLEKTDGPKRRKKEPRKPIEIVEETVEEVEEMVVEEIEITEDPIMEEVVEEEIIIEEIEVVAEPMEEITIEEFKAKEIKEEVVEEPALVTGVAQGNPVVTKTEKKKKKKSKKAAKNVAFEEPKIDNSKIEEHVVAEQNEESKAPKTIKDRYIKMTDGKGFEVRLKGSRIFNSPVGNTDFDLTDTGITINNKHYRYSEVVIRIKN